MPTSYTPEEIAKKAATEFGIFVIPQIHNYLRDSTIILEFCIKNENMMLIRFPVTTGYYSQIMRVLKTTDFKKLCFKLVLPDETLFDEQGAVDLDTFANIHFALSVNKDNLFAPKQEKIIEPYVFTGIPKKKDYARYKRRFISFID